MEMDGQPKTPPQPAPPPGSNKAGGKDGINMATIAKKRLDILINAGNRTYTQSFELDKTIKTVRGILVAASKDDLLYYRGTQRMELNRLEIFPDGYESKLLMSGINTPVNQRYFNTGNMPAGNGTFKITYVDLDDARAPFEPYRVSVYLDCELQ